MEKEWVSLLVQVPLVAAFIWYSLEQQKRNQVSMDKRDEAYLRALVTITQKMELHDLSFQQAVTRMEERTRPRSHNQP